MRAEPFMYFCEELHRYSEWRFFDSKSALNSPVVYNIDRSKAVVLVLFLFCVALRFLLRRAFRVETCLALCSRVFQSCLRNGCDHLVWGRESWSMCFSCICLFILFIFVIFPFLLVSWASSSWKMICIFTFHEPARVLCWVIKHPYAYPYSQYSQYFKSECAYLERKWHQFMRKKSKQNHVFYNNKTLISSIYENYIICF